MDRILSALQKIKIQHDIQIPLVIAGKEDFFYKKFYDKTKTLKLDNQVIFLGEVTDTELQSLYKNALALISPSLMEGFDLPVAEAMANSCLVLASNIAVHREICKDAAIYFDEINTYDIISKIVEIYNNTKSKYKENIKNGKTLTSAFNWQRMAIETLAVYNSL